MGKQVLTPDSSRAERPAVRRIRHLGAVSQRQLIPRVAREQAIVSSLAHEKPSCSSPVALQNPHNVVLVVPIVRPHSGAGKEPYTKEERLLRPMEGWCPVDALGTTWPRTAHPALRQVLGPNPWRSFPKETGKPPRGVDECEWPGVE